MNCKNPNCHYRTIDCQDEDLIKCCRIYKNFEYNQAMKKETEAELKRQYEENDIGLIKRLNGWNERKVV